MFSHPLSYDLPLFRPPSEARSLILQVTLGCSWNGCAFCEMYRSKRFSIRSEEVVMAEIRSAAAAFPETKRIFLADGDALAMPAEKLLRILFEIRRAFPAIQRVSSYALPANILRKRPGQLKALHEAGLTLIYVGIESGHDALLKRINKNETKASTIEGLVRAKGAGIKSSVMVLNGLGGTLLSEAHAIDSADVLNETQPEFASTLVLSFPAGETRFRQYFGDGFEPLNQRQLFLEQQILIEHCRLEKTVFRSDHASNYLILKGILNRDRARLLEEIQNAIDHPTLAGLRKEYERGL